MAIGVLMPKQGITVESCVITEWRKNVGDRIEVGDVLFAYETDKSSFECEATEAGTMLARFFEDGDEVPVLVNVCAVGNPGEDYSALAPKTESAAPAATPAAQPVAAPATPAPAAVAAPAAPVAASEPAGEFRISPRAKAAAEKLGLDPTTASPSGPYGRVIERDLATATAYTKAAVGDAKIGGAYVGTAIGGRIGADDLTRPAAAPTVPTADYTDEKLSGVRKSIAKAMTASLSGMAQLTHNFSFDATEITALRAKWKANGEKLGLPNITLNDIILFAVSRVVKKHPYCNAHMLDDKIRVFNTVNLGMAVDTERGLLVPTIFNADKMSLAQISVEAKAVAKAAQGGSISPDKLSGGTITVSNLGSLGVESFTPIINPPQTCIIGVDNIQTKIKMVDGQPVFYPAMGLSLTYDHRAVDGAPASRFMQELCGALENFSALLTL